METHQLTLLPLLQFVVVFGQFQVAHELEQPVEREDASVCDKSRDIAVANFAADHPLDRVAFPTLFHSVAFANLYFKKRILKQTEST